MSNVSRVFIGYIVLGIVAILIFGHPVTAQDEGTGGGHTRVKDGDKLEGEEKKKGNTGQTQVKFEHICKALEKASEDPDREKTMFSNGDLKFWGHEKWISELICEYIKGNEITEKDKPPLFGPVQSKEQTKEILEKQYEERRKFLTKVLDAFQKHSGGNWKETVLGPPTFSILRERLLVGKTLYQFEETEDEEKGLVPHEINPQPIQQVVRSKETPDKLLLGMQAQLFWGPKGAKLPPLEAGEQQPSKVIPWIKAGEFFLLRAYALAATGNFIVEDKVDYPPKERGSSVEKMTNKFRDKYLRNSTERDSRATYQDTKFEKKPEKEAEKKPEKQKRPVNLATNDRYVELKLDGSEVPAKDDRGNAITGLSLFLYQPIRGIEKGQHNPRAWFVQWLAQAPGGGLDPGGINFSMWKFHQTEPLTRYFPDRLIDETTKAAAETRIVVTAACVVRIHYYTHKAATGKVKEHELKHFKAIRDSWIRSTEALGKALKALGDQLNGDLANPPGAEAFQYEPKEVKEIWKLDPAMPDLTAIPEGWISAPQQARLWHTDPQVSYLRFRLIRRIPTEKAEVALVELLKNKKPADPQFNSIQKSIDKWKKDHWASDNLNEFRNMFVGRFLLDQLILDENEGEIDDDGNQSGRSDLKGKSKRFADALKKNPQADPLQIWDKLTK